MKKYNALVARLKTKIERSQTRVPGFIIGLSGSDSILAFDILNQVSDRVLGVHYVNKHRRKLGWFDEYVIPWLRDTYPKSEIIVAEPLGGNQDQQRWADLHIRALNEIGYEIGHKDHHDYTITPRNFGENYWVAGSINATEKFLGKYSMLANSASIQPIERVYKSEVLQMCEALGVPKIVLDYSRIPDCLCGRDELAANNIELIDKILRFDSDVMNYDQKLVANMYKYISNLKNTNDFKKRIPYIV